MVEAKIFDSSKFIRKPLLKQKGDKKHTLSAMSKLKQVAVWAIWELQLWLAGELVMAAIKHPGAGTSSSQTSGHSINGFV